MAKKQPKAKKVKEWHIWAHLPITKFVKSLTEKDKKQKIVLFCAEEYELPDSQSIEMFSKLNDYNDVHIIFGTYGFDHIDTKKYPNIKFYSFPTYFLYFALYEGRLDIPKERTVDTLFTCMNHQPHEHRHAMMYYLSQEKLLKNNYYSWHFHRPTPKRFRPWKIKMNYIDGQFKGQQGEYPPPMYKSAINLVTESTSNIQFITEKTYSSIIRKQPFIVYGCQGINQQLEEHGFKLYRNVIDYSFDDEPNNDLRAEKIAKELKRLSEYDPAELYKQMTEIAAYNQTVAKELIKSQYGVPELALTFKYYNTILQERLWKLDSLE